MVTRMPTVSIVIPAFNEAGPLLTVLPEVLAYCKAKDWHVVVVNDGSTDTTQDVLEGFRESHQLTIVRHNVNRGYGGALKSGIAIAKGDAVATMDADGQHSVAMLDLLLRVLIEQDADLVIGCRTAGPVGSIYRGLGRWLIRKFAGMLIPLKITDLNSGFKLYRRELVQRYLGLCPDSMSFSDVMALVFVSRRHLVAEVPVARLQRLEGKSSVNTATAFETLLEILNIIMLLDPLRMFVTIALLLISFGLLWGIPIMYFGHGVSVGSMLAIVTGLLFFFLGFSCM